MSLNSIMSSSLSGMYLARAGLQTTSHNIANAGRAGFSRQELMIGARNSTSTNFGLLGGGAEATGVRRLTDDFLVDRMRTQGSRLTYYSQVDSSLSDIETVLGSVDNDHLGTAVNEFFAAWNDLATPPVNNSLRQTVLHSGQKLATEFNNLASGLNELATEIDNQIEAGVNELNIRLAAVATLNQQISSAEAGSSIANDLRDQREIVLGEISTLANIDVTQGGNGAINVIINGRTVVTGENYEQLAVRRDESTSGSPSHIKITTADGRHDIAIGQGHLSGLIDSRDEQVLDVLEKLDSAAAIFAEKINEIHVQGETTNGHGIMFFSGDSADSIQVNSAIADNVNLIATSRNGYEGDTELAQEIASLTTTAIDENGNTLGNLFTNIIVDFASRSNSSKFMVESQLQLVQSIDTRLEGLRGVSLDEEAANMARYQNAYDASARMVSVVQEMFDTLFNIV